ncbi:hypothetical protein A0H81_07353 [Grifola frondosa]|uniref:Uncharacterized protein n=1 Tax=Grifola frondosa TaxID=5627 RepID=A0A1C7M8L6_GRIFR|nr:hypothetical protein A0H81_07353 [Grifola frondosa]
MSDARTSPAFNRTLADKPAGGRPHTEDDFNYTTGNYPPPNDTCSFSDLFRGYGSPQNVWSPFAQRGNVQAQTGLVDQSPSGSSISDKIQDPKQGQESARRDFVQQPGVGLDPYGRHADSRNEAAEKLISRYTEARDGQFERGFAGEDEEDVAAYQ